MSGMKSMFRCELCNVEMTGTENYNDHIAGKKHLKKLKSSGQGVSQPVNNQPGMETGKSVKTNQSSMVTSSTSEQTVQVSPPAKPVTDGDVLGTSNDDPVMNAVKANLLGKLPLKKQAYEGRCDICCVDYTSTSHEEQHLSGKKHIKKAKLVTGNVSSATLYCAFCDVKLNSVEQMEQHRNGTSHLKKVNKARIDQGEHSPAKKRFVPSSGSEPSDNILLPPSDTPLPKLEPLHYDK